MSSYRKIVATLPVVLATAVLVACGGGGGSASNQPTPGPVAPAAVIAGTASVGAPLSGAEILVIDAKGKSVTGTADSSGAFKIDATSLQFPAVVFATGMAGDAPVTYAGVAATASATGTTIANATPFTDAILTQALGRSAASFQATPAGIASLSIDEINRVATRLSAATGPVIDSLQQGAASKFNPLSSEFSADGKHPYDKVLDLVNVFVTNNRTVGRPDISLMSRAGETGAVTLVAGSIASVQLPPVSAAVASLPLDKIADFISRYNQLASTQASFESTAFADLFDPDYRHNGADKATRLAYLRARAAAVVGSTFSNPQIIRCDGGTRVCRLNLLQRNSAGSVTFFENRLKYDPSSGQWRSLGNGYDDLLVTFSPYAFYDKSDNKISVGFGLTVRDEAKSAKYGSATVEIVDADGNPIDGEPIRFRQKSECPVTSNSYYGMPVADATDNPCRTWFDMTDSANDIRDINQMILNGGLRIRARAYRTTSWTDLMAETNMVLTTPLLHPDDVSVDMFPDVQIGKDSQGPFIRITNAADFSLVGSVCLSSAAQPQFCDMTNLPRSTSEYRPTTPGVPSRLEQVYRPKEADAWSADAVVRSYFVNARDKYGRNLRAAN